MISSIKFIRRASVLASLKKTNSKNKRVKTKTKKVFMKTLPVFEYPTSKSSDRRVYVWGLAEHGALGTGEKHLSLDKEQVSFAGAPIRLTFAEYYDVIDIASGYGFSAFAIKSNGKNILYGSGINSDSQIGYHEKDEKLKIPRIRFPRPIELPLTTNTANVLDLAAGRAHLLVLTDQGLFTLGNNSYGQCGRPIISNENYLKSRVIHKIQNIGGVKIKSVVAGQDHSIILTENGEVFTFGWGADGQTGLGHYKNEYKPSLVKGDLLGENIVKIACTSDCVLALSDKGVIFGWGNAEYSQLPLKGDNQQINIATKLKMCEGMGEIVDVASGGTFCMALNKEGIVYVWGFGILGLGPQVQKVVKPTPLPLTLFGSNAFEPNVKVTKIFCGISHLAAVTNSETLYMWGRNKYGMLGLGHCKDQYFPLKVAVGAGVLKVSCGVDHTIAICKPFI